MLALETRPFEARFGTHCPFCGRSWNDRNPCGDSRADWSIRDGLRLLFADRVDNCVVCDRQIPQGRKRCLDCALSVEKYRAKQDRHAVVANRCVLPECGRAFTVRSDKKGQRFCSRTCSMKNRRRAEEARRKAA